MRKWCTQKSRVSLLQLMIEVSAFLLLMSIVSSFLSSRFLPLFILEENGSPKMSLHKHSVYTFRRYEEKSLLYESVSLSPSSSLTWSFSCVFSCRDHEEDDILAFFLFLPCLSFYVILHRHQIIFSFFLQCILSSMEEYCCFLSHSYYIQFLIIFIL